MDPTLYARFYYLGQLLCPTGGLGLLPRHLQYALFHQMVSDVQIGTSETIIVNGF